MITMHCYLAVVRYLWFGQVVKRQLGFSSCDSIFVSGAKEIHKQQKLWQHEDEGGRGSWDDGNWGFFKVLYFWTTNFVFGFVIFFAAKNYCNVCKKISRNFLFIGTIRFVIAGTNVAVFEQLLIFFRSSFFLKNKIITN